MRVFESNPNMSRPHKKGRRSDLGPGGTRYSHKLAPPFVCPWSTDGCRQVSATIKEHKEHMATEHEIPLMRERIRERLKIN